MKPSIGLWCCPRATIARSGLAAVDEGRLAVGVTDDGRRSRALAQAICCCSPLGVRSCCLVSSRERRGSHQRPVFVRQKPDARQARQTRPRTMPCSEGRQQGEPAVPATPETIQWRPTSASTGQHHREVTVYHPSPSLPPRALWLGLPISAHRALHEKAADYGRNCAAIAL